MNWFNVVLWLASLLTCHNFTHSLKTENINGGRPVEDDSFGYQVAILGRLNSSRALFLVCNAGLISDKIILTTADCLFTQYKVLKEINFSIIPRGSNFQDENAQGILLTSIFIPYYEGPLHLALYLNNIAAGMLAESLDIAGNQYLSKLELPNPSIAFEKESALVAGFVDKWEVLYEWYKRYQYLVDIKKPHSLRYAPVRLLSVNSCLNSHFNIPTDKIMCGMMITDAFDQKWSLSKTDSGSPLVSENMIVGIAIGTIPQDHNVLFKATYTKVQAFSTFIDEVLRYAISNDESVLDHTLVYDNRPLVEVY